MLLGRTLSDKMSDTKLDGELQWGKKVLPTRTASNKRPRVNTGRLPAQSALQFEMKPACSCILRVLTRVLTRMGTPCMAMCTQLLEEETALRQAARKARREDEEKQRLEAARKKLQFDELQKRMMVGGNAGALDSDGCASHHTYGTGMACTSSEVFEAEKASSTNTPRISSEAVLLGDTAMCTDEASSAGTEVWQEMQRS